MNFFQIFKLHQKLHKPRKLKKRISQSKTRVYIGWAISEKIKFDKSSLV